MLHNGVLSSRERRRAALINCGSPAALTAFTAAEEFGLHSWERPAVHVLVPGGAHITQPAELLMRVHYVGDWNDADVLRVRDLHRVAPALVLAASTFAKARPACGLLAAGVQQRLVTAPMLRAALSDSPRVRHRHALLLAVEDVAQGAQALSEIDFVRLCRKNGLPEPQQQAVRIEKSGRRRYVDATWLTRSGRRLAVEVDGALHLASSRWWDDQLRQNELVLSGDLLLRFPSVVLRHDAPLVTSQLRRGLIL
ncbi:MAG: hypothetical protein QOJ34_1400 [Pseudonocardiales bacterium]|nr:hypothetical protein [Pseudonocardiales bacterium]